MRGGNFVLFPARLLTRILINNHLKVIIEVEGHILPDGVLGVEAHFRRAASHDSEIYTGIIPPPQNRAAVYAWRWFRSEAGVPGAVPSPTAQASQTAHVGGPS